MSALKKIFVILATIGVMLPAFAFADDFGLQGATQGTKLISAGKTADSNAIPNLIGSIVGVALSFVGAIFFLLILYAGFLWMTAFGSSEKVDKAKDIVQHAAMGLIIVLAAYAISKFVFNALATATSGGSADSTGQAGDMGCCFNSVTNNKIQTLQPNCVSAPGNPRTWTAGPCS
jgi:hypothetical protein